MAATQLRVLVTHRDAGVRRRLRQALLGEPDIELVAPEEEPSTDLAERMLRLHPDIVLTGQLDEARDGPRILTALQTVPTPPRIVLLSPDSRPPTPSLVPIDQVLLETASRGEILRSIRLIQTPSTYLSYLPAIFGRDDFTGRFLRIFEAVVEPIDRQIDDLAHYLDPDLTPAPFLPWLASWLASLVDDRWPRERQIAMIRAAPELHRWRGTRRGLREHLRLYLGPTVEPEIEETAGGLRLGPSTQLGLRTVLGESGPRHHFSVTLRVPEPGAIDYTAVAALIDAQKPAHCSYSLSILPLASPSAVTPESREAL
jgi:phage tail-like protein